MKKGIIQVDKLVSYISLMIVCSVLMGTTALLANTGNDIREKNECRWSFALNSVAGIPPECEGNVTILSLPMLEEGRRRAEKRIKEWNANDKYKEVQDYFKCVNDNCDTIEDIYKIEYSMDEYIAKSMKNCWDKVWKGRLPIFDRTWNVIDVHVGGYFMDTDEKLNTQSNPQHKSWFLNTYGPPTFCVLCETIKFEPSLVKAFEGDTQIESLTEWMDNNPVVPKGSIQGRLNYYDNTPYSKYLEDDLNTGIFRKDFLYDISQPQAVLYSRVNVYGKKYNAQLILNFLGVIDKEDREKDINVISVVPYNQLGERCHYLIK